MEIEFVHAEEALRITLELVGVRMERLDGISEKDVKAEGVESAEAFRDLWGEINGHKPKMRWETGPEVWVHEFRVLGRGEKSEG